MDLSAWRDRLLDLAPGDLALMLTTTFVLAAIAGILLLKPILRLLIGRADPTINETIGYATASFSLFYALLLGLLTVAAYQNREAVGQDIEAEAGALGALYADMGSYPEPLRSRMRGQLRDYTLFTIHKDWPAHRRGEVLNGGANRVDALRLRLAGFEPQGAGQEIVHAETLSAFGAFAQARQQRLNGVITRIPDVLWQAVLVGAALNLLIIVLLRIKLVAHLILGTISAFFLGVVLFVIAYLDDPLRGEAGLDPDPFRLLWDRQMAWDEGAAFVDRAGDS
ncbi:DUF4239 domain-containing protein [Rubellimicrobium aerolatum]|uniref:DUF4239 domain-containing protein n=1 Tax=Rubellimicrobium aerolatum TaxID=490979 RepID=A0ABW0S8Y1_9RHOB|nr:DUF4239 domain-containing protein [Rubellimicrobium aerolatum]MBP1804733.1 hypothetical protein [Rubellimicrobium aerolatum]